MIKVGKAGEVEYSIIYLNLSFMIIKGHKYIKGLYKDKIVTYVYILIILYALCTRYVCTYAKADLRFVSMPVYVKVKHSYTIYRSLLYPNRIKGLE